MFMREVSDNYRLRFVLVGALVLTLALLSGMEANAQIRKAATGAVTIDTGQPGSVVYINKIRHGSTGEKGLLELPRVKAGAYPVRVRTVGYTDWAGSVVVIAGASRALKVRQQPTTDQATLHYQKGDQLRDKGKGEEAAVEYQQAIGLRPVFAEARVALARILMTQDKFDEAEVQLSAAMKNSRVPYVEAQVVLANLRRSQGLMDESIAEYRKALRLARNVSPEAHIGLAIALEETGKMDEAIKEYRIGIAQDMDTEPILYYLLGSALEKESRNKEAIEAYQNYLRLDPEGQYASAVESIIERLKEEPENDY